MASINFLGRGQNVVGDIPFPEMHLDPPVAWANFDELNESTKGCEREVVDELDAMLTAGTWEFWIKQLVGGDYQDAAVFTKVGSWTVQANAGREYGYRLNFRGVEGGNPEVGIYVPDECTIPRGSAVHCAIT